MTKCKRLYNLSLKYAYKFKNSWDYSCLVLDTYADAYKKAREDCQIYYESQSNKDGLNFNNVGEELEDCNSQFKLGLNFTKE